MPAVSIPMPLLERDEPLARLDALLRKVGQDVGAVVCVTGEAGIGKTSLVTTFVRSLPHSVRTLWGACEPLTTPRPLGPLVDIASALGGNVEQSLADGAPRHTVFAATYDALAAQRRTTVLVVEDVHWADEATLDLVRYLGRRLHRLQVLLVLTWRADEVGVEHPLHRALGELPAASIERIALQPLSVDAVAMLTMAGDDASRVHALTGGNPFFVTELVGSGSDRVPVSVREAVLARRARLPVEARQVVDLVSVMPVRAEIPLLRTAVDTDAVTAAIDAGLLTADERSVGFRHELARLAVLESLPVLRVQDLHRAALEALRTGNGGRERLPRLVHHAVGAGDAAAVVRFAPAGAREAAALGAHREAVAHLRTVLAWADGIDVRERAALIEQLAYECYLTSDVTSARAARREALGLWRRLRETRAIGRNTRWLSRLAWFVGDQHEAQAYADEAITALASLGDDEEHAMALSNRAQLHMLAQESAACERVGQQAVAMARAIGSIEVLSHALNNIGAARVTAGDLSGRPMLEESLQLALDHDLHEHAARAFTNLAACAIQGRDNAYARRWLDPGINYCAERDLDAWRLYMLAWRARLGVDTGRWDQAEADARAVIDDPRAAPVSLIPALTALGQLHARQGRGDAEALLDRALQLAEPTGEAQRIVPLRAARAELALLRGRREAARDEADAGLACVAAYQASWGHAVLTALRRRATGASDRADGVMFTDPGAEASKTSRLGDWQATAASWARLECPYEQAEALADGDVPALERALEIFRGLGARPAADRVRQRLRHAGVRRAHRGPQPSTRCHPAGLTRREAEILTLLAEHLSNPAIATRLFVSPKTVEHHVSALLSKLEVTSRADAVELARRRGWLTSP